jgi:hypothetical protein
MMYGSFCPSLQEVTNMVAIRVETMTGVGYNLQWSQKSVYSKIKWGGLIY